MRHMNANARTDSAVAMADSTLKLPGTFQNGRPNAGHREQFSGELGLERTGLWNRPRARHSFSEL